MDLHSPWQKKNRSLPNNMKNIIVTAMHLILEYIHVHRYPSLGKHHLYGQSDIIYTSLYVEWSAGVLSFRQPNTAHGGYPRKTECTAILHEQGTLGRRKVRLKVNLVYFPLFRFLLSFQINKIYAMNNTSANIIPDFWDKYFQCENWR